MAHAAAACHCDPRGGEDLSIVEIGGQDAKYIRLQNGRIVESDLNHACSAGTGSFLEEQAGLHGVDDIAEMTRLASSAARAPDLGQMCTVYVADAAAEALREGFTVGELFSGFQYSVIHNYINRGDGAAAVRGDDILSGQTGQQSVSGLDVGGGRRPTGDRPFQPRGHGGLGHRSARPPSARTRFPCAKLRS